MAATITETTQFLTYKLGDETFALDITKVREVLDFTTVTKVPRTPEFMRGVINLRGSVVPVVDLRLKFGMTRTENGVNTCIIITEVTVDGDTTVLGALADSVQEVLDLEPGSIPIAAELHISRIPAIITFVDIFHAVGNVGVRLSFRIFDCLQVCNDMVAQLFIFRILHDPVRLAPFKIDEYSGIPKCVSLCS